MTDALVLDANVIVKLLIEETGSETAQRLFDDERFSFWTPGHAFAEVTEVLSRKVRLGAAREQQLREAPTWLLSSFVVFPIEHLLETAVDLALRHAITVYDALYVALALDRGVRFVTDDRRLVARLQGTPVAEQVVPLGDVASSLSPRTGAERS